MSFCEKFHGFRYQNASKQYVGIDKDLIEEIGRRSGCRFSQESDARARIWIRLAEGSLDMSVSGIPTPERDQFARFIIYFQTRNHLLMAPEKAARIDSCAPFMPIRRCVWAWSSRSNMAKGLMPGSIRCARWGG
jgi:polar amino acid transport system substrate-binding protein